ncbi:MAG: MCE family protein [Actinomycetota bacterium]|nr:MCE family protein [Actinomycetota bacterium]
MSRSMGYRLIALLVVAILGVYYIAFDAVGIRLWGGPYTIKVQLPAAGGIYSHAAVTYRGVEVGKVTALHLRPDNVVVDLAINNGVKIPTNVQASVKELTAAAEQYMDLVPPPAGTSTVATGRAAVPAASVTYLKPGGLITGGQVPTSVGTLLNTLNSLVNSLHANDLNTISTSLAQGLQGAGGDLRSIITDSQTLIQALYEAVPGTIRAVDAGQTVLQSLANTTENLQTFSAGLNSLSTTIKQSNSDLIALLQNGSVGAGALNSLLSNTNAATVGVINGFSATAGLANARQGAVQAFFQVLPVVANNAALTVSGSNARFELTFNDKNTVCPYTSSMAEPTSLVSTLSLTRNCSTTAPDLLQRGADKAPTPGGTP